MLESIIVYTAALFLLPLFANRAIIECNLARVSYAKDKYQYLSWLFLIIILWGFVFGARYNVGIDYLTYKQSFEDVIAGKDLDTDSFEPGFLLIQKVISITGHYFFFFTFFCILQILPIIVAFHKRLTILPWILVVILTTHILLMMNLIRQTTFACFLIWVISRIDKISFLKYSCFIFLSTYFLHKSAMLLLPLYPFIRYKGNLCGRSSFQILFYLVCLYLGYSHFIIDKFDDFSWIANLLGYTQYAHYNILKALFQDPVWGPRTYIRFLIPLVLIVIGNDTKCYFKDVYYNRCYNMFFWGECWQAIFYGTNVVLRVGLPFYFMKICVGGYTLAYLNKKKRKSPKFFFEYILLVSLLLLDFTSIFYEATLPDNTSAFIFFWQQ